MYHLIYVSRSVRLFTDNDMNALLVESRKRNSARNLTGMLLYVQDEELDAREGRFIQVLEGAEPDVRDVFEAIRKDPRHHHITVVDESSKAARDFENWSMGFEHVDKSRLLGDDGTFELDKGFLKQGRLAKINVPLSFLRAFYSMKEGLLKRR